MSDESPATNAGDREPLGSGAKRIQSVERAIELLKLVISSRSPLSVSELAALTEIHRSTAWRLLMTLEHHGLIDSDPLTHRYTVGYELLRLAELKPAHEALISRARPILDELVAATRETATLYVPVPGDGIVSLDQRQAPQVASVNTLGVDMPLNATASGKARLAFATAAEREVLLAEPLRAYTECTITDLALLNRELARIRQQRFALEHDEFEPGVSGASAPILKEDGNVAGFLSIAGLTARLPRDRLQQVARQLREASDRVAHAEDTAPNDLR